MQKIPMTQEERASFKNVVYAAEPGAPCPFVSGSTVLAAYDAGGHHCRSIWRFEEKFMREHKLTDSRWTDVLAAFVRFLRENAGALAMSAEEAFAAARAKVGLAWEEMPGWFCSELTIAHTEMKNQPSSPLWKAPAIRVEPGAQLWRGHVMLAV